MLKRATRVYDSYMAVNTHLYYPAKLTRVEKLISRLTRNGKKLQIRNIIQDVKIRIAEYFNIASSSVFFEAVLESLEPVFDISQRKTSRKRLLRATVIPCSIRKKRRLALDFFIKAVRANQKQYQFSLATSIMNEILAIINGHANSLRYKSELNKKVTSLKFSLHNGIL
jgi:ribosomal protein S7